MTIPFRISESRPQPLTPTHAVILYEGADRAIATLHRVRCDDKSTPTILAGKALSVGMSRKILRALSRNGTGGSFLPACVLMASGDALMWYEPPMMRHLGFKQSTHAPERSAGTFAARVPTPGVIFLVDGARWLVMAYRGDGRPTPETPLYRAPTLNTYEDGSICAGNVKTPASTAADRIQAWSDAFWRSNFTHANFDGVVDYEGDAAKLWQDARDGQFGERFPDHVLKPYDRTVGQYLETWRKA